MALPYYPDSVKILALFCFGCHHSPDCAAAPQIYLCVGVVGPIMAMMALVIPTILIWPYIQQFCHWSKTFWSILSTFTKQSNVWSWYPYFGLHGVSKKLRFSVQLCPGGWGLIHHLFDPLTLRCGGGEAIMATPEAFMLWCLLDWSVGPQILAQFLVYGERGCPESSEPKRYLKKNLKHDFWTRGQNVNIQIEEKKNFDHPRKLKYNIWKYYISKTISKFLIFFLFSFFWWHPLHFDFFGHF